MDKLAIEKFIEREAEKLNNGREEDCPRCFRAGAETIGELLFDAIDALEECAGFKEGVYKAEIARQTLASIMDKLK